MTEGNKVLLFGVNRSGERGGKIYEIMDTLGIQVVDAGEMDFHRKVLDLIEGKQPEAGENTEPDEENRKWQGEFMLMCGLEEELLNTLIRTMRENGVSIGFKAMANENNINWKLIDLMEEIKEEHEKMQEYIRMHMEMQKGSKGE